MAAMGIDYFELGKKTGAMAAKILKGEATAKDTDIHLKQREAAALCKHRSSRQNWYGVRQQIILLMQQKHLRRLQ